MLSGSMILLMVFRCAPDSAARVVKEYGAPALAVLAAISASSPRANWLTAYPGAARRVKRVGSGVDVFSMTPERYHAKISHVNT